MIGSSSNAERQLPRPRLRSVLLFWLAWIVWLPFLAPDIAHLFHTRLETPALVVLLLCLLAFIALYAAATYRAARRLSIAEGLSYWRSSREKWLVVGLLCLLGIVIAAFRPLAGTAFIGTFVYTAAYSGAVFRTRHAILLNAALFVVGALTALLVGDTTATLGLELFLVGVVTFMTVLFVRSTIAHRELLSAQEELARLAVANERLRIARDLHDLLGHRLSLIGLKSDLALRLLKLDPNGAADEIGAIGREARSTLQEVREAVSRYHTSTIEGELRAAREILSASAIECRIDFDREAVAGLPADPEAALAWVVREGVTNVVRHSAARTCAIGVSREAELIRVEVRDDGRGGASSAEGNGLRGLRDRLAAMGGWCEARGRPDGGFVLTASVPAAGADLPPAEGVRE